MAPSLMTRPSTLRISALALAALSLPPMSGPALAQTVYREYDDGSVEVLPDDEIRERSAAPLRRPPPRAFDEDEDDRFEREDDDDDFDDDQDDDVDRQGTLDLAPDPGLPEPARKAPAAPPSVDARPADNAWKPAL